MPRAKREDLRDYYTTSSVADLLGLSAYLIKARIQDGSLPEPTKVSESGVLLFDEGWMTQARGRLTDTPMRLRARETRPDAPRVPGVKAILGHAPGDPDWIPSWENVQQYFHALAAESDRVVVEELGKSTNGRPYIAVTISAPENLDPAARARNTELLSQLWDPRDVDADQLERALDAARPVGIILATQHSTEIGATLMTLQLTHDLAAANDDATLDLLANTICVLVPSHNPDGIDMIHDWNQRYHGTDHIGADLPFLYHPYTGHDNNRDWFMMTQAETRLFVHLHNREHPQAVFDMHQMNRKGVRYMVPPFIDPLDPNQDPLIQQGFAALGSHIARRMTADGHTGVATHCLFDNYSPSLAYGNYHGSVDLLSEAASANLASPITLRDDELTAERGIDPKKRTWNHPDPWPGGTWSMADIVAYNLSAAKAFFDHLASHRRQWLEDYLAVNRRAVARTKPPYGYVIPAEQRDPVAASELLELLQRGLVEVQELTSAAVLDGVQWPTGTRVVLLNQPASAFAKTLLEVQDYPEQREYADGPQIPPYDTVGHTLGLQMGVDVIELRQPLPKVLGMRPLPHPVTYEGRVSLEDGRITAWVFDERSLSANAAATSLMQEGVGTYRALEADRGHGIRIGSLLVPAPGNNPEILKDIAYGTGVDLRGVSVERRIRASTLGRTRLGVFQPYTACMDEGWARWVLEEYDFPFTTLKTPDIRQGELRDQFDVILLPHMTASHLRDGQPERTRDGALNVPEFRQGLGDHGMAQLRRFVAAGGTLVAVDGAVNAVIEDFALPVRRPLAELKADEFSCPGSLLRVVVNVTHPLGYGLPRELPVLFMNSVAMEPTDSSAKAIATYPMSNPRLSGWIHGHEKLQGKAALVDVSYGDGAIVLIGFRPWFRAQIRGTYKVLFNAITRATAVDSTLRLH